MLEEIIRAQQGKDETNPAYMVGEQLLEMAAGNAGITELLEQDLQQEAMSLKKAAEQIEKYADGHRGNKKVFCVPPKKADEILRKFYGLPEADAETVKPYRQEDGFINLDDFL